MPFLVSAFGVFMMRQYAVQAVPDELIEAARVDGCSHPAASSGTSCCPALRPGRGRARPAHLHGRPGTTSSGRCVVLTPENPTVQVALSHLSSGYYTDYVAGVGRHRLGTVPLVIVFIAVRPPDHRRHHGRCGQGVTRDTARCAPPAAGDLPAGLRLGRGHRRLPDRGRGRRGRPRPVDLGHLQPHARAGSSAGDTGDVACDHYHR